MWVDMMATILDPEDEEHIKGKVDTKCKEPGALRIRLTRPSRQLWTSHL